MPLSRIPWLVDYVQCLHAIGQPVLQLLPSASMKTITKQRQNHFRQFINPDQDMSGKKWMYGQANKAGKGIAKELGVHQSVPPNVWQICREKWLKIHPQLHASLSSSYMKHLAAAVAAKVTWQKTRIPALNQLPRSWSNMPCTWIQALARTLIHYTLGHWWLSFRQHNHSCVGYVYTNFFLGALCPDWDSDFVL